MKTILTLGGLIVLVIGGMTFLPNVQESFKETIEVEKTVEVDALEKRIEAALEAAAASTTEKAQAAYNKVEKEERERIEAEEKIKYIKEIESTLAVE